MAQRQSLRIAAIATSLVMLVTACGGDEPAGPPRIRHESYTNVFARVYEQYPDERWWSVITEARSPCESCSVTFRTSLRADTAQDLIDAAMLCNAVIAEIFKSGVKTSVKVEGTLRQARVVSDGSLRISEDRSYRLASGEIGRGSAPAPDRCEINGIMANTHDELKAQGWRDDKELSGRNYDLDTRRELRRTDNFFTSTFSSRSRQLDDGTWAYFRR